MASRGGHRSNRNAVGDYALPVAVQVIATRMSAQIAGDCVILYRKPATERADRHDDRERNETPDQSILNCGDRALVFQKARANSNRGHAWFTRGHERCLTGGDLISALGDAVVKHNERSPCLRPTRAAASVNVARLNSVSVKKLLLPVRRAHLSIFDLFYLLPGDGYVRQ